MKTTTKTPQQAFQIDCINIEVECDGSESYTHTSLCREVKINDDVVTFDLRVDEINGKEYIEVLKIQIYDNGEEEKKLSDNDYESLCSSIKKAVTITNYLG